MAVEPGTRPGESTTLDSARLGRLGPRQQEKPLEWGDKNPVSPKSELSIIRRALVPWHRAWDLLDDEDDEPAPPPRGVVERLARLIAEYPTFEPGLREAITVYLLLDYPLVALGLTRRLIDLPGKKKASVVVDDKEQLVGLERNAGKEASELLERLGLTHEKFCALGRYVEESREKQEPSKALSGLAFTQRWALEEAKSSEDWEGLRERLFASGLFNDFGVREAYFEMARLGIR